MFSPAGGRASTTTSPAAAYRRDLRADFYLDFGALTDGAVRRHGPASSATTPISSGSISPNAIEPRNVSPAGPEAPGRRRRAERADGLIGRIRRRERIYERYLLPLAGDGPGARQRAPDPLRPASPARPHPPAAPPATST